MKALFFFLSQLIIMIKKPVNRRPTPTESAFLAMSEADKMRMFVYRYELLDECCVYMTNKDLKENVPVAYIDVWWSLCQLRDLREKIKNGELIVKSN